MGRLTRTGGGDPPVPEEIALGQRTVLGRLPPCDVRIDDDSMSRQHAVVVWRTDHYEILDLESLNGTRVDGRRLERGETARLALGTEISFGLGRWAWRVTSVAPPE